MIELLVLAGGIVAAGMSGMWVTTRRRTNKGNTAVAIDRFENAARRVSSAQAQWFDLQNEAVIIKGGLDDQDAARLARVESETHECSRELYEAWLPVSDVDAGAVASYDDDSRKTVSEYKLEALAVVERFERKLNELETVLDELRK